MWALMVAQASIPSEVAGTGDRPGLLLLVQAFTGLMGLMAFALAADVQRRTRAEEDLRLSEVRYRALFHGNPEPVWVHDRETGRMLDVNEAALRQYGYSRPQFLSLTAADLQAEESDPEQKIRGSLLAEDSKNGESLALHRKSDGSTVPVEVSRSDLMIEGVPQQRWSASAAPNGSGLRSWRPPLRTWGKSCGARERATRRAPSSERRKRCLAGTRAR
jgi:PAS domain S-box-containing protein